MTQVEVIVELVLEAAQTGNVQRTRAVVKCARSRCPDFTTAGRVPRRIGSGSEDLLGPNAGIHDIVDRAMAQRNV